MVSFDVYDQEKNVSEQIELDDSVFGSSVNDFFLHQVLVGYQANKRQGTAQTKTRSTIRGTKSKPFRQKGTGRARQGTMRAPHHKGGARQFGPIPRSYRQVIPKKMKQEAFRQCLSLKVGRGQCFVLKDLDFPEIKTKQAAKLLDTFEVEGRTLFIDVDPTDNTLLSIRNLSATKVISINACSPLDIFESEHLFLTKQAAELFQERYSKQRGQ